MKKIIAAVALSLPLFTQAAVLDMVPFLEDSFGNIHLVEQEYDGAIQQIRLDIDEVDAVFSAINKLTNQLGE